MLESKFLFVSKIFFLAFFIINIPNLLPFNVFESSYWFLISTTIFDTTTLLVISLSASKYIYLKNLKIVKDFHNKDSSSQIFIEKIDSLRYKTIQNRKTSFILTIFFLILTLMQPIILIFDINKNDIYSSNVIETIRIEFNNKKKEIEKIISIQKNQVVDEKEINKLQNSISKLSNIRDKNVEQFLKSNTKNRFNTAKIIFRNVLLGFLWTFVFYKLYLN